MGGTENGGIPAAHQEFSVGCGVFAPLCRGPPGPLLDNNAAAGDGAADLLRPRWCCRRSYSTAGNRSAFLASCEIQVHQWGAYFLVGGFGHDVLFQVRAALGVAVGQCAGGDMPEFYLVWYPLLHCERPRRGLGRALWKYRANASRGIQDSRLAQQLNGISLHHRISLPQA